jgi:hypothetical protein
MTKAVFAIALFLTTADAASASDRFQGYLDCTEEGFCCWRGPHHGRDIVVVVRGLARPRTGRMVWFDWSPGWTRGKG